MRGLGAGLGGSAAWLALAATLVAASPAPVGAQEGAAESWQWSFTPYAWGASIQGKTGVKGVVGDVDLSAGDVLHSLGLAFMGVLDVRRGRWHGSLDGFYVSLSGDRDVAQGGGTTHLRIVEDQGMLAPAVAYTAIAWPGGGVDATVGLRYWLVSATLTATPSGAQSVRRTQSTHWVDAVVGTRVRVRPWGPRWRLFAHGDLGGGGSNFTWQALGGASYDFSHCCAVLGVYRHLDVDYETSSFTNDVYMTGPALGVELRF